MEYNTERNNLIIPEYGRNVQKMVEYCLTIQDRQKRNEYAQRIIVAMSQVNQTGKDSPNYKNKLWDHLFIISGYKLDVDSPFPVPVQEDKNEKPKPLAYRNSKITFRTYGAFSEQMIHAVSKMKDGIEKQVLTARIAQELKKQHLQWNVSSCDDEVILKHLDILSSGKLKLDEDFKFKTTKELIGKKTVDKKQQAKKKKNANNKNKQK